MNFASSRAATAQFDVRGCRGVTWRRILMIMPLSESSVDAGEASDERRLKRR